MSNPVCAAVIAARSASSRAVSSRPERSTVSRTVPSAAVASAASLRWRHTPPTCSALIRRMSWWSRTAVNAALSASASTSVSSSRNRDWLKWPGASGNSSKYQCWTGVSGTGPTTGPCSASGEVSTVTSPASSAMVWRRNICLVVSRRLDRRASDTTWRLRIESPPRLKKLSSTPIRSGSTPSTFAQTSTSTVSTGVRGATRWDGSASGSATSGRARRSRVPFGVIGSSSRTMIAEGTAWLGRLPARNARSSARSGAVLPAGTT